MTPEVVEAMRDNEGISEFSWVYSGNGDRNGLNEFFANRDWTLTPLFITMINTTWVHNVNSTLKPNNGQTICENLTYLPNLNEMNNGQITALAKTLADYCRENKL